jgi:predicted AlkP superfamily phosphohydrolase/phosphomutase
MDHFMDREMGRADNKYLSCATLGVLKMGVVVLSLYVVYYALQSTSLKSVQTSPDYQLYWFIPDGLRADPQLFKLFDWAREGKLPNIKKMMDQGSYGYSIPVFPSHTPINYATLLTGVLPQNHGATDGPIRIYGSPLSTPAISGFSSNAKKVDPIWYTLEQHGVASTLLAVPGSTPPELNYGQTIKGRWGGWGHERPSIIFQSTLPAYDNIPNASEDHIINHGNPHTHFITPQKPKDWVVPIPPTYSPAQEIDLSQWQPGFYALLIDSTNDNKTNYDSLYLSHLKTNYLFSIKEGQWSEWVDLVPYMDQALPDPSRSHTTHTNRWPILPSSKVKFKAIKLGETNFFRLRILHDDLNPTLVSPKELNHEIQSQLGPMVDFPDNNPQQLINFKEDRTTFLEESRMSMDWHRNAAELFLDKAQPQAMIHSTYTPNQMLTSRWWIRLVDPLSDQFDRSNKLEREQAWDEILEMYQDIDRIIGVALKKLDKKSFLILSSDHGAIPLNYDVRINNYFKQKGWLHTYYDQENQTTRVDWSKTRVIYLMTNHIYINPRGLDGPYFPGSGPQYEDLRNQVIEAIKNLSDHHGAQPISKVLRREESHQLGLPMDRVGDLITINTAGFNLVETLSSDQDIFVESLNGGYKQGVDPSQQGLWTPFIIVGPGIKKNYQIKQPISHLDQYPTLLKALGITPPHKTEHTSLDDIFVEK